tara:strand:- start:572 stop:1273 length:702 start_codon:yes stop_codon:yes gene_type:complete
MNKNYKIYIIHYSKLVDRKKYIESLFKNLNIEYEYIESFDKEELTEENISNFYDNNEKIHNEKIKLWGKRSKDYYKLTSPEISVSIKHLEALKKIENNEYEFGIILEDDVIPEYKNFKLEIENLIKSYKKWDVLFVGEGMGKSYRNSKIGIRRLIPFKKIFKMEHPATNCLEAYIIKKSSVNKILEDLIPINLVIDWELAHQFFIKNLNIYWSKKILFNQGSKNNIYKSELRE